MTILPIESIAEIDQPLYGANLFNLSKLKRCGLPVLSGIAVTPPEIILQVVLKHFKDNQKEFFEERLILVKKELAKIPLPPELQKELTLFKEYSLTRGELVLKKKEQVWLKLLESWVEEIKNHIWNEGLSAGVASHLSAQAIFKIHGEISLLKAYFDPEQKEVIISTNLKLSPPILKNIDQLVLEANKKLFLPQVYSFLLTDDKVFVVGLKPFTQTLPASIESDVVIPKQEQRKLTRSAIKLFLNLSSGLTITTDIDGILIESEKVEGIDNQVFKLVESGFSFPGKPVIFKLPDIVDAQKIRGTLRLIHQKSLLDEVCDAFVYARNKKSLYNLEVAVPLTRSVEEFLQIKRELAVRDITRKGSLKLWLEMSTPENFLNLDDYIKSGFDGAIVNLDLLQKLLGGYEVGEGEFYKRQTAALIKFLQPSFKQLHREKIPILILGELTFSDEILDFLIESGVYGVVVNTPQEAENMPEHLSWVERRMVAKRLLGGTKLVNEKG